MGVAYLWAMAFPFCKNMWSSSFVVLCAGWSLLLLALFYFVIDVLGFWRWSFFFIVIGMNPILIYLAKKMVKIDYTSQFFFGGLAGKFDGDAVKVVAATAYIVTWWLVLLLLYRKKIFLRV